MILSTMNTQCTWILCSFPLFICKAGERVLSLLFQMESRLKYTWGLPLFPLIQRHIFVVNQLSFWCDRDDWKLLVADELIGLYPTEYEIPQSIRRLQNNWTWFNWAFSQYRSAQNVNLWNDPSHTKWQWLNESKKYYLNLNHFRKNFTILDNFFLSIFSEWLHVGGPITVRQ